MVSFSCRWWGIECGFWLGMELGTEMRIKLTRCLTGFSAIWPPDFGTCVDVSTPPADEATAAVEEEVPVDEAEKALEEKSTGLESTGLDNSDAGLTAPVEVMLHFARKAVSQEPAALEDSDAEIPMPFVQVHTPEPSTEEPNALSRASGNRENPVEKEPGLEADDDEIDFKSWIEDTLGSPTASTSSTLKGKVMEDLIQLGAVTGSASSSFGESGDGDSTENVMAVNANSSLLDEGEIPEDLGNWTCFDVSIDDNLDEIVGRIQELDDLLEEDGFYALVMALESDSEISDLDLEAGHADVILAGQRNDHGGVATEEEETYDALADAVSDANPEDSVAAPASGSATRKTGTGQSLEDQLVEKTRQINTLTAGLEELREHYKYMLHDKDMKLVMMTHDLNTTKLKELEQQEKLIQKELELESVKKELRIVKEALFGGK